MIKNNDKDNVCIGLCVWNGQNTIKETLVSLLNQNFSKKISIIILDNQSDDLTVPIIKDLKKKNKKKNIDIKLIIDKKKRNVVNAQNYLIKKYFKKFQFCMLVMDDDIYHKNFIYSTFKKLKKEKLDLVYTYYMMIDEFKKKFKVRNKPEYSSKKRIFFNLSNYIIFRNINPIFFGLYKVDSLLELIKFYNHFDKSKSNHDNIFIFNFLLNKKVGIIKKSYFYFLKKNRNKIEEMRKTGPNYWKKTSIFTIFVYQFNFSLKILNSIYLSDRLNLIEKILLFFLIIIIYFQKTFSYVTRWILK